MSSRSASTHAIFDMGGTIFTIDSIVDIFDVILKEDNSEVKLSQGKLLLFSYYAISLFKTDIFELSPLIPGVFNLRATYAHRLQEYQRWIF